MAQELPADYTPPEDRGWVIVLFGSPGDGGCGVDPCPMSAVGPFRHITEAKAAQAQMPEWTKPHVLALRDRP